MTTESATVDIVTTEIIRNSLVCAAEEMARALCRTAVNPLIYEVRDYGCVITSSKGELWSIVPGQFTFVGTAPAIVTGALEQHDKDFFREGDAIIVNDPFPTGTHISDTTVLMPVFADGKLLAFVCTTTHWADIGGATLGGWSPDTTDVHQEGIIFSYEKLIDQGQSNETLLSVIRNNVRLPDIVMGDLAAQIASCRQGKLRVNALCDKYSVQTVEAAMASTIERSRVAMHKEIEKIPDGTYCVSQDMDHDGVDTEIPYTIAIQFTVERDRLRVSFEGTAKVRKGPVNVSAAGCRAALNNALIALLRPQDLPNAGHMNVTDQELKPGLVLSAEYPAPCDSYAYVCNAVFSMVLRALGQHLPEHCPAGGNTLCGVGNFRVSNDKGQPFLMAEPMIGGGGALPNHDGPTLNGVDAGYVPMTPIEILEKSYPVLIERYEYAPETAGAGCNRGGFGVRRAYLLTGDDIFVRQIAENTKDVVMKGRDGGQDGKPPYLTLHPDTDSELKTVARTRGFGPFNCGTRVSYVSSGGGGLGNPMERDPQRVAEEVRDELLSAEQARKVYGVVLEQSDHGWLVMEEETQHIRQSAVNSSS